MYEVKTFNIPELKGISQKNIEEHLGLYKGYVTNTNNILEALKDTSTMDAYAAAEMQRRFSFEFNGMRNHEFYFESLEGGAKEISPESALYKKIESQWGSFATWLERFKTVAKTRGVGWAVLSYDKSANTLITSWVDEQHFGHLNSTQWILGIDMWEHAFVADYQPSGKGQYIEDFFANLNWNVIEKNFEQVNN
jgi:Fe-Mn family superoxide dismutase